MIRVIPMVALVPFVAALLPAAPSQTASTNAWRILEQGVGNKRAAKRANAVHALRLLSHNPRAQQRAERLLADPDANVRAAAARALGSMELCRRSQS
jgi:HEAT repeat protein